MSMKPAEFLFQISCLFS